MTTFSSPTKTLQPREVPPVSAEVQPWKSIVLHLVGVGLVAALIPACHVWAGQVGELTLVLTLPGVLLLRALRFDGRVVGAHPVLVPAASICVLYATGLGVDVLGPMLGVQQPLRTVPVLVGLEVLLVLLTPLAVRSSLRGDGWGWGVLLTKVELAAPLVIPAVTVIGALRLNNQHDNLWSIAGVVLAGAALVGVIFFAGHLSDSLIRSTIYSASLASLLSYSLRTELVYGYDIATEYRKVADAIDSGVWHFNHISDAYGSLLSITVLPAQLHALTGFSGAFLLKVVFPVLVAFVPVVAFSLARLLVSARWAAAAALILALQRNFGSQTPGLARQEIAYVVFAALVTTLLLPNLRRGQRLIAAGLLSMGLLLSHYSTTYLTIGLLLLSVVVTLAVGVMRKTEFFHLAPVVALAVLAAGSTLWYGVLTQSAANVGIVQGSLAAQGLNLLPNASGNIIKSVIFGNTQTPMTAQQYAQGIEEDFQRYKPFVHPLPAAADPMYGLRDSPDAPASALTKVLSAAGTITEQFINLAAGLGALFLALRRSAQPTVRLFGSLSLGMVMILGALKLSGTLATAYNQDRALLQALILLASCAMWTFSKLGGERFHTRQWLTPVVALCLALSFITNSSLIQTLFDPTPNASGINLANVGEDYDRFYISAPEVASAAWVGANSRVGNLVYADGYAVVPYLLATGRDFALMEDVTPSTLDSSAWVYANRTNIIHELGRGLFQFHSVSYQYPLGYLDDQYNVVYSNGVSTIFHR